MITLNNYSEQTKDIDFSKQSDVLQKGHKFFLEYSDLYNDDDDIKRAIDNHLQRLNDADFLKKHVIVAKLPKVEQKDPRISYDRDSDSFWVNDKSGKGQKSFETRKEAEAYLNEGNTLGGCQILDAEGKPDISPEAIKKLEECSENLIQTKVLNQENGKYTATRQKLHDAIVAEFKKEKPCVQQREPVAILTGGPPGSGKTTWLKKYAKWITGKNVYHIDADEVRAKLPEYKGWNATQTHLETKDIVNQLIDDIGVPCEFDLVYDGTMNKAESYEPLVNKLRGLGYKIFIIYISVPKEVSEKRVLERYRKRGRYVPKIVIDEVYERGLAAFEKLTKEADGFIRVDGVTGKLVEKGGMAIPKKTRYQKTKDCHSCGEKKGETKEQKEKRIVNAEQFIKDLEAQPAKLKAMSEEQIIKVGLEFEKTYRSGISQKRDESHDGKKRLSPTPENLIRWMKHPGYFDLIGVDTFERIDPTADYKKEISKQKFWNNVFGIKLPVKTNLRKVENKYIESDKYKGQFTIGKDDGEKPMYTKTEIKLLESGWKIENEYRAKGRSVANVKEMAKELKQPTEVTESENEFGGNFRIWIKK